MSAKYKLVCNCCKSQHIGTVYYIYLCVVHFFLGVLPFLVKIFLVDCLVLDTYTASKLIQNTALKILSKNIFIGPDFLLNIVLKCCCYNCKVSKFHHLQ